MLPSFMLPVNSLRGLGFRGALFPLGGRRWKGRGGGACGQQPGGPGKEERRDVGEGGRDRGVVARPGLR